MIKKILRSSFLCFLMFFAVSIAAQIEIDPRLREVISSGGGTADIAGFGSIDFTIGEAIITLVSVPNATSGLVDLTQGFQQLDYPPKESPEKHTDIKIYSGFTPNGDNINETWIIDYINDLKPNTVSIFNRWGNLVWEHNDYNNADVVWKGTNQKDTPLPDGTYFYIIKVNKEVKKGWVELTR